MNPEPPSQVRALEEAAALRAILEGTAGETGKPFFDALVESLARALHTRGAWVTEYVEDARRLRALAFWFDGHLMGDYEYAIDGTPCEPVIDDVRLVHIPDNIVSLFPGDNDLEALEAVSYMGVPLLDLDRRILGHLAVIDSRPMPEVPTCTTLFRIFAARAAAEHQRLRAESELRLREERLGLLIGSTMDAILELDQNLCVTLVNPAACGLFGPGVGDVPGRSILTLFTRESCETLAALTREVRNPAKNRRQVWIPGVLHALNPKGKAAPVEATLSSYETDKKTFFTLILRDLDERLKAEHAIRSLTRETEYLREEIRTLEGFDEIIGESDAVHRMLRDMEQVAATSTTVLLQGETGTGKEIVARAIHRASTRHARPLVRVNCAAIPAALMESEFFGHEKGAFTGATQRREGRFALADGGTIFLDEVGELPGDLQAKLLRVLQEGEFEPVGSSTTQRVDVRIIAATNRDLSHMVHRGAFREDLYYRLDVFPINLPPLRERGDDAILLAEAFVERFSKREGRTVNPLTDSCKERLRHYDWPGNVRELENVIERAVITSRNDHIDLDRALPRSSTPAPVNVPAPAEKQVLTVAELQDLERDNIRAALEATAWRVSGDQGAARLLGVPPSTLSSRMKALGIRRPSQV